MNADLTAFFSKKQKHACFLKSHSVLFLFALRAFLKSIPSFQVKGLRPFTQKHSVLFLFALRAFSCSVIFLKEKGKGSRFFLQLSFVFVHYFRTSNFLRNLLHNKHLLSDRFFVNFHQNGLHEVAAHSHFFRLSHAIFQNFVVTLSLKNRHVVLFLVSANFA